MGGFGGSSERVSCLDGFNFWFIEWRVLGGNRFGLFKFQPVHYMQMCVYMHIWVVYMCVCICIHVWVCVVGKFKWKAGLFSLCMPKSEPE